MTTYVYDDKRWDGDARARRPHGARTGSPAPSSPTTAYAIEQAHESAALRGRQLLRQRQADRRGRRPAAVRRRARVGHERQGRLDVEPDPLGQPADGQGDVRPADGLPVPVHGRPIKTVRRNRAPLSPGAASSLSGWARSSTRSGSSSSSSPRSSSARSRSRSAVHLLKTACTSRAWRNTIAAAYPEERGPVDLDLRGRTSRPSA